MSRRRGRTAAAPPGGHLQVLPGQGRRFAHLRQAAAFYVIIGLTALLVLQAGYHWLGPLILARRLRIVTAAEGCMEQRMGVEGMITRQELLLRAPCSGIIVELAPAGERAPAGTVAAVLAPLPPAEKQKLLEEERGGQDGTLWDRFKSYLVRKGGGKIEDAGRKRLVMTGELPPWLQERVNLILPEAGLLLHRLDGWENPGGNIHLASAEYAAAAKEPFEAVEGLYVEEDQPFMRVIDNWQWCYHLLLPLEQGQLAAARNHVLLELTPVPEQPFAAELISAEIDSANEVVRLTYSVERQASGCEDLRWIAADLILERHEGIILPAGALVDCEGLPGVFLNQGGRVRFSKVDVIRAQEGEVMVEGLEPGTMVISRPELVKEGQRLD